MGSAEQREKEKRLDSICLMESRLILLQNQRYLYSLQQMGSAEQRKKEECFDSI